jgi:hypothetical protein
MDSTQQHAIVQPRTPDGREAEELAAAFEALLGTAVRRTLIRYDGAQPDEWMLRIAGLDDLTFELAAVRRFIESAKAMALGGRRVQLVALVDGSVYAVSSRGVHEITYATGAAALAGSQIAAVVLENSSLS